MNPVQTLRKRLHALRAYTFGGSSPESLAAAIALGLVLGVFPVFGLPTVLCALAAGALRLNIAAIQAVNYLAYPLQMILLVPFLSVGEWLIPAGGHPQALHWAGILNHGVWHALAAICAAAGHAIAGWLFVAAPAGALLYFTLKFLLRRSTATFSQSPGK